MLEEFNQVVIAHYLSALRRPGLLGKRATVLEVGVAELAFLGSTWLRRYIRRKMQMVVSDLFPRMVVSRMLANLPRGSCFSGQYYLR